MSYNQGQHLYDQRSYQTGPAVRSHEYHKGHHHYNPGYPPSKKHKGNLGVSEFAPNQSYNPQSPQGYPQSHAYYQQPYPPSAYPPQTYAASPPIPPPLIPPVPPSWAPPPPPGWKGPVQPQRQYDQQPASYQQQFPYPQRHHTPLQTPVPPPPQYWPGQSPSYPHVPPPAPVTSHRNYYGGTSPPSVQSPHESPPVLNGRASVTPAPTSHRSSKRNKSNHKSDLGEVWCGGDIDGWLYGQDEAIDQELDLGTVVWTPGRFMNFALPATSAEFEASEPPEPVKKGGSASVSRYVTAENLEEHCRPIRETRYWPFMKDDPVFSDLSSNHGLVPFIEIRRRCTRQTPSGYQTGPPQKDEYPYDISVSPPARTDFVKMDLAEDDDDEDYSPPPLTSPPPATEDIVDEKRPGLKLETIPEEQSSPVENTQSVSNGGIKITEPPIDTEETRDMGIPNASAPEPKSKINWATIPTFVPQRQPIQLPKKPVKPPDFAKDQAQEDILAKLGVTGSPRPVFATPGPAYVPRERKASRSRSRSMSPPKHALHDATEHQIPGPPPVPVPPPPPEIPAAPSDHEINGLGALGFDLNRSVGSPRSITSQHTLAGSDFDMSDDVSKTIEVAQPKPVPQEPEAEVGVKTRKRARQEAEQANDSSKRQKDDISRRLRTRQPKVAPAYGRRW